ncbi:MAG: hypothetical protein IJ572_00655 [Bacilli bacterium]|nr:hypothetical protein [Bacilli bacterium]
MINKKLNKYYILVLVISFILFSSNVSAVPSFSTTPTNSSSTPNAFNPGSGSLSGTLCSSFQVGRPANSNLKDLGKGYFHSQNSIFYSVTPVNCPGSYVAFCLDPNFDGVNQGETLNYSVANQDMGLNFQKWIYGLYSIAASNGELAALQNPGSNLDTYFKYEIAARVLAFDDGSGYPSRTNVKHNSWLEPYRAKDAATISGTNKVGVAQAAIALANQAKSAGANSSAVVSSTLGLRANQIGDYTYTGGTYSAKYSITIENYEQYKNNTGKSISASNFSVEPTGGMSANVTGNDSTGFILEVKNIPADKVNDTSESCSPLNLKLTLNYPISGVDPRQVALIEPTSASQKSGRQRYVVVGTGTGSSGQAQVSYTIPVGKCGTPNTEVNACEFTADLACTPSDGTVVVINEGDQDKSGDLSDSEWENCIIDHTDTRGNAYNVVSQTSYTTDSMESDSITGFTTNGQALTSSNYCTIACKEKYTFVLPGYKEEVKQGTYFSFHSRAAGSSSHEVVGVGAQRDCVSTKIDVDKFETVTRDLRQQQVDFLNLYLYYYQLYMKIKNEPELLLKAHIRNANSPYDIIVNNNHTTTYSKNDEDSIPKAGGSNGSITNYGKNIANSDFDEEDNTDCASVEVKNRSELQRKYGSISNYRYLADWDLTGLTMTGFKYYKVTSSSSSISDIDLVPETYNGNINVKDKIPSFLSVASNRQSFYERTYSDISELFKSLGTMDAVYNKYDSKYYSFRTGNYSTNTCQSPDEESICKSYNGIWQWVNDHYNCELPDDNAVNYFRSAQDSAWNSFDNCNNNYENTKCNSATTNTHYVTIRYTDGINWSSGTYNNNVLEEYKNSESYKKLLATIKKRMDQAFDKYEALNRQISIQVGSIQECTNYLDTNTNNTALKYRFDPNITFTYPDEALYNSMLSPNLLENVAGNMPEETYIPYFCGSEVSTSQIFGCSTSADSLKREMVYFKIFSKLSTDSKTIEIPDKDKLVIPADYYRVYRVGSKSIYGRSAVGGEISTGSSCEGCVEYYQSATQFYTTSPKGTITTSPVGDSSILDTDGRVYPVTISSSEGTHPYYVRFSQIGQYSQGGGLGRIMGGNNGIQGTLSFADTEACYYEVCRIDDPDCGNNDDSGTICNMKNGSYYVCDKATLQNCTLYSSKEEAINNATDKSDEYCGSSTNRCDSIVKSDVCNYGVVTKVSQISDAGFLTCLKRLVNEHKSISDNCCTQIKYLANSRLEGHYAGNQNAWDASIRKYINTNCNGYCSSFKILSINSGISSGGSTSSYSNLTDSSAVSNNGALQLNARTVSNYNLFPNGVSEQGVNWKTPEANETITRIQSIGDGIFEQTPDYTIVMNNECVNAIKDYNKNHGSEGFNDFTLSVNGQNAENEWYSNGNLKGTYATMNDEFKNLLKKHCGATNSNSPNLDNGPDGINDSSRVRS